MGVSERTVRECAAEGAETVEDVGDACGAGTGCGNCHGRLRRMIENHFAESDRLSSSTVAPV
ncbi:(2Fe-2S)-binding protein [Haloglycomyces albus]|uniref:(2Fe-2S)-binding protein n=1 Tax=Haloglycomyces albus TaxID=526067 RepID=UPI001B7FE195|nr:(2Fe-2S)-binding protein [Haloglycomyces albus]